jgi:hypothetical protein
VQARFGDNMAGVARPNDMLVRRRISFHRYLLEDAYGRPLSTSSLGIRGTLKSIETESRTFACSTHLHLTTPVEIRVADRADNRILASGPATRSGTITTLDEHHFPFHITDGRLNRKRDRLAALMILEGENGQPAVTLQWRDAAIFVKPFAFGQAVIGELQLDHDLTSMLVCLAFHLFAVALTPKGG